MDGFFWAFGAGFCAGIMAIAFLALYLLLIEYGRFDAIDHEQHQERQLRRQANDPGQG
jgi:ABC-type phosphate/phosphonate transport system permease subunit